MTASRRVVALTLDTLDDLPSPCRSCVHWELDPVAARRAAEAGGTGLEKEAWVSGVLLEWGSCGRLAYVDRDPAGYVLYAPPSYVPRSTTFPTSPVSPDAVLMTSIRVQPEYGGTGLGRMLVRAAAKDLATRNIKALEAFADAAERGSARPDRTVPACLPPADFLLSVGFRTVRPHPRTPRLRLDLRTAVSWREEVEVALERILGRAVPEPSLARV